MKNFNIQIANKDENLYNLFDTLYIESGYTNKAEYIKHILEIYQNSKNPNISSHISEQKNISEVYQKNIEEQQAQHEILKTENEHLQRIYNDIQTQYNNICAENAQNLNEKFKFTNEYTNVLLQYTCEYLSKRHNREFTPAFLLEFIFTNYAETGVQAFYWIPEIPQYIKDLKPKKA